jgi:hypothetical protein
MESPGKFIADEELRESIKAGGLGTQPLAPKLSKN